MTTVTVIQIVRKHLADNGYTGLMVPGGECGCELDDLQPCGESFAGCVPGYRHADPREKSSSDAWAIWSKQEPPTAQEWEDAGL